MNIIIEKHKNIIELEETLKAKKENLIIHIEKLGVYELKNYLKDKDFLDTLNKYKYSLSSDFRLKVKKYLKEVYPELSKAKYYPCLNKLAEKNISNKDICLLDDYLNKLMSLKSSEAWIQKESIGYMKLVDKIDADLDLIFDFLLNEKIIIKRYKYTPCGCSDSTVYFTSEELEVYKHKLERLDELNKVSFEKLSNEEIEECEEIEETYKPYVYVYCDSCDDEYAEDFKEVYEKIINDNKYIPILIEAPKQLTLKEQVYAEYMKY